MKERNILSLSVV